MTIASITYIGKESNRLEEVEEQSLLDPREVYTEYPDPRRDEWATKILPKLKATSLRELINLTGLPRSTLQAIRAGRRPQQRHRRVLAGLVNAIKKARTSGTKQNNAWKRKGLLWNS